MTLLDKNGRMARLRKKLILDTDRWLGARMPTSDHGEVVGNGSRSRIGSLVEPLTDEHGHMDNEQLSESIDQLHCVADRKSRGDIMVDLSDVRSATPMLVRVLDALSRYLAVGGRRVVLCGAGKVSIEGLRLADFTPLPVLAATINGHQTIKK